MTLIGLVLEALAATGILPLDEAMRLAFMENVAIITGGFVIGQGVADMGKEKAKVEKEAKS